MLKQESHSLQQSKDKSLEGETASSGKKADGISFVYSLSNNTLTPYTVSHKKLIHLEKNNINKKNIGMSSIKKKIFFSHFKKDLLQEVFSFINEAGDIVLSKNINNQLPEDLKLELLLSAFKNKKLNLVYYLIEELKVAKNIRIRSSVLNIQGLLASKEGRLPEAVYYWKESLRYTKTYEPAILNLGFTALKYGDFDTAEKMLNKLEENWFVLYAKACLYRLIGKLEKATVLYQDLIKKKGKYKPLIYNYAIHLWQSNNDISKAQKIIKKALKIKQGPSFWNEKGQKVLARIQ